MRVYSTARVLIVSAVLTVSFGIVFTSSQTPVVHYHHVHINCTDPAGADRLLQRQVRLRKAAVPAGSGGYSRAEFPDPF
jgi:hypothetical protein